LVKKQERAFSLYDVEQFLKDAGADRINEKAVISLESELRDMVNEIVNEAAIYANYAGRKRLIDVSDIELASKNRRGPGKNGMMYKRSKVRRPANKLLKFKMPAPKIMLINNVPIIKTEHNFI
jgi:histone H3/H4